MLIQAQDPRQASEKPKGPPTIATPPNDTEVVAYMIGLLCQADGAGATNANYVHGLIYDEDPTNIDASPPSGTPRTTPSGDTWNLDLRLYGASPDGADRWIKVWNEFLSGSPPVVSYSAAVHKFKVDLGMCTMKAKGFPPTPHCAPTPKDPSDSDKHWWKYEDIEVGFAAMGTMLLDLKGDPLLARKIRVFASDFLWKPDGVNPTSSPAGDDTLAPDASWWRPYARQHCIMLWQPIRSAAESEVVRFVTGTNKHTANRFTLDPHRPIFVQVNGQDFSKHTGEIALKIHVLETD